MSKVTDTHNRTCLFTLSVLFTMSSLMLVKFWSAVLDSFAASLALSSAAFDAYACVCDNV
jgi:hypothetical protein